MPPAPLPLVWTPDPTREEGSGVQTTFPQGPEKLAIFLKWKVHAHAQYTALRQDWVKDYQADKMEDDCLKKWLCKPFRSPSGSDEDVADVSQALLEEGRDSDLSGHERVGPGNEDTPVEESHLPQEVPPQMVSRHSILSASLSRFIVDCSKVIV